MTKEQNFIGIDFLTGMLDMMHFYNYAEEMLGEQTEEKNWYVIYFDIDHFKTFNEQYGFEEGDKLLKKVASLLQKNFQQDLMARFSDDHFVVLTDREDCVERIHKVHLMVHDYQKDMVVELKAGVCLIEDKKRRATIGTYCDRARMAGASVKGIYDEDTCIYDKSFTRKAKREKYIIDHIDEAVEKQYLQVYYQPIVRVLNNKICSMESLVRWIDPKLGFLSPIEFIPILEKAHLIHKVDTYVIQSVAKSLGKLRREHKPIVPVSVNLSRLDMQLCDIFSIVDEAIKKNHLHKDQIHIEITESALNDDPELMKNGVAHFKENGYQIWMDDFGSEYSSLNLLQNFDFNVLKIDMKFFDTFETNEKSKIIIAAIVNMSKQLGLKTVAEGIETEEEYRFLKQIGCDMAQGYFLHRPDILNKIYELGTEVAFEEENDLEYYNALSKVNYQSMDPLGMKANRTPMFFGAALAVVEYRNGRFNYISYNQEYLRTLQSFGIETPADAERLFNVDYPNEKKRLVELIERTLINHTEAGNGFFFNNCVGRLTLRIISESKDSVAYIVNMANITQINGADSEKQMENTLKYLFAIYNRVDLIDCTGDKISNIYLSDGKYDMCLEGKSIRDVINDYADLWIMEEEKNRFKTFLNMISIEKRMAKEQRGYLEETFSIRVDGKKKKYRVIMIPVRRSAGERREYIAASMEL